MENEAKARAMTREAMNRQLKAGADLLRRNLSSTSGSGIQYPNLPNRSSAPGEYPTMQTGELRDGVGWEATPTGGIIFIEDDLGKLIGLEFSAPSEGGRAPMRMFITDEETHRAMREAR